jgi:hypothetical protein
MTLEELQEELEIGFLKTIVALFDCRHDHAITVLLHQDLSAYWYVMTDQELYFSSLGTEQAVGRHLPASYRFRRPALLHNVMAQEIDRRFQIAPAFATFRDADDEEHLRTIIAGLRRRINQCREERGDPPLPAITDVVVESWRTGYAADNAPFVSHLRAYAARGQQARRSRGVGPA